MVDAAAGAIPSSAGGGWDASETWESAKNIGRKGKEAAHKAVKRPIRWMATGFGLVDYSKFVANPRARMILNYVAPALVGACLSFGSDMATAASGMDGTRVSSIGGTLKAAVVGGMVGQAWDWYDAREHREAQRENLRKQGRDPAEASLAWGAPVAGLGLLTSIVYKITRTPEAQGIINRIVWEEGSAEGWRKLCYAPLRVLGTGFGLAKKERLEGTPGYAFIAPAFVGGYISGGADLFSAVSPLDGTTQSSMGKTLYGSIVGGMAGLVWDWAKAYRNGKAGNGLAWGAPLAGLALLINILYKISRMPEGSSRITAAATDKKIWKAVEAHEAERRRADEERTRAPVEPVPEGQMELPGMEGVRSHPTPSVGPDLRGAALSDDHLAVVVRPPAANASTTAVVGDDVSAPVIRDGPMSSPAPASPAAPTSQPVITGQPRQQPGQHDPLVGPNPTGGGAGPIITGGGRPPDAQ